MDDFKVGDDVEFELGPSDKPRWDFLNDRGSTGVMKHGRVVTITPSEYDVRYPISFGFEIWTFPQPSYIPKLYLNVGCPVKIGATYPTQLNCNYDYTPTSTYQPKKCTCGKDKSGAIDPHYRWCDLYEESK